MRLMIMFDLPVETSEDRRNYRKFRRALIDEGFLMMQYSIYVRVCKTKKSATYMEQRIATVKPPVGTVQTLMITEAQYQAMHFMVGTEKQDIRNLADRTVII
ncbi:MULTISPECIES: CRISPR-associated endonuclease Cas2 [Lacticaseibacillus]|uniref:CRISPR-associated endoribonuclease Cas2 n=1 Tax=Lacticaseibacillus zeae subsp. silagei TaxID=3068307 RepID=A0ABD7Z7B8_LACZE|nr:MULTISPECIES: CRISPR-associated endonuclease Cas2 [Lacticaseibacillus]OFR93797.1 CRISPR-associated endonuclease Cas2 [Lactobacillus sp. HMSC068F07]KLI75958.1 CRISPR-associated protein Cas2 [Lacticaseibacillus casei]MDE3315873.1 CRISPR-associated endonuclease Cas2 [Lacticaseibacillus zeae]WLV82921.1 CRISPR-associated endonuclease Cas2 [Lacticaseibacillus sp. NCIMB 15475]WLV85669.1 CRISPR-associated endonuclease Cas2 [Lacticaseibacillus sp. NCIMB 15474]